MVIADASPLTFDDPFVVICAAVVAVFAVARWTRLIVDDDYPPTRWLTTSCYAAIIVAGQLRLGVGVAQRVTRQDDDGPH